MGNIEFLTEAIRLLREQIKKLLKGFLMNI